MLVRGINHFLFSVSNLEKSIEFYESVFEANLLVKGETTAYFDLNGMWIALNEEKGVPRKEIKESYTHIAFTIDDKDFEEVCTHLHQLNVDIIPGRLRAKEDKKSIYFQDPDGHKFEFHTGTLMDRIEHYKKTKPHMKFNERAIKDLADTQPGS
ncbi:metallothiol transferase FosB [Jeotgalibacillus proteolyticus]|uniref:metallothiol transferase FosB n=1 Tax=Jeotgalibacillus proteolyticus TaxID=2082395 RepID=UPI003CF32AC3